MTKSKSDKPGNRHWPADHVERRKVADLIPYARNARTHSDAQIAQIAASIREWGWTMPVLLDEGGGIIAGHGRVLAARKLGIDEVPAMTARGWSDAQKRAYVLADNQLALNAGWDNDLLKGELLDLRDLGFDDSVIGFDESALDLLLNEPKFEPGSAEDQSRLDQLSPKTVRCPSCGEEFDIRKHEI